MLHLNQPQLVLPVLVDKLLVLTQLLVSESVRFLLKHQLSVAVLKHLILQLASLFHFYFQLLLLKS